MSHVLLVPPAPLSTPGGVTEVVRALIEERRTGAGARVDLLLNDWNQSRPNVAFWNGVRQTSQRWMAPWDSERPLHHLLRLPVRWPPAFVRLLRTLRSIRPDGVNVHLPDLSGLTLLWACRLACPDATFVVSLHGSDVAELEASGGVARWLWLHFLRRADRVVCCSRDLRRRLLAALPGPVDAEILHNGISPRHALEEAARGCVPPALQGRRFVVCVAMYARYKGHDVLIEAFDRISRSHPDYLLVLIGAAGPAQEETLRQVDSIGLTGRTLLLVDVPHEDTLAIMQAAELLVLPSREETFGLVLLEAAALGVPVIASRVGGIPEIVTDGVTGTLVPNDDPAALAAAIANSLGDVASGRRLAAAARARVLSEFGWQRVSDRYDSLLQRR